MAPRCAKPPRPPADRPSAHPRNPWPLTCSRRYAVRPPTGDRARSRGVAFGPDRHFVAAGAAQGERQRRPCSSDRAANGRRQPRVRLVHAARRSLLRACRRASATAQVATRHNAFRTSCKVVDYVYPTRCIRVRVATACVVCKQPLHRTRDRPASPPPLNGHPSPTLFNRSQRPKKSPGAWRTDAGCRLAMIGMAGRLRLRARCGISGAEGAIL